MHTLRRIAVGSAFKVGAALSALLFAVLGFFVVLLPGIFGASILGALLGERGGGGTFGLGFIGSLIAYVLGIVLYWILGGIISAVPSPSRRVMERASRSFGCSSAPHIKGKLSRSL